MKKIFTKEQLQAHKRKLLLVGLAVLVLSITAVGYISTLNEVFVTDGDETMEVQTRKNTVKEVLEEADIDYIDEDQILPDLETEIEDGMEINITRAVKVEIFDGEEVYTLLTPAQTVEDALEEAGISLIEEDEIDPALTTPLREDMEINITRALGVDIIADEEVTEVKTTVHTVADALEVAGISLGEDDAIEPAMDTPLEEGMKISITRAVRAEIQVDGEVIEVMTTKDTVEEVLGEAEVVLEEQDKLNCDLEDPIKKDMEIAVIRVTSEVITETEELDFNTKRQNDSNLEKGKTRVAQEGQKGQLERKIKITNENGEEVEREVVSEETTKRPVERIVNVGTKEFKPAPVNRGTSRNTDSSSSDYRSLTVEATAYSSQDPGVGTITATGETLRHGIIAVDPRVIPLGTKLYVPGYGYGVAADTGGAIKGNKIDLAYMNRTEALKFGRQTLTIRIYD